MKYGMVLEFQSLSLEFSSSEQLSLYSVFSSFDDGIIQRNPEVGEAL